MNPSELVKQEEGAGTQEKAPRRRRGVLLSRAQADLTKLARMAEKAVQNNTDRLKLTPEYAEATEGHILIRVPPSGYEEEDFPEVDGQAEDFPEKGVLLPPDVVEKAFANVAKRSSTLPVLEHALVTVDEEGRPTLHATSVDTRAAFSPDVAPPDAEHWPDTEQHLEEARGRARRREGTAILLNVRYLKPLLSWLEKHSEAQTGDGDAFFYLHVPSDPSKPCYVRAPVGVGAAEGLLMPVGGLEDAEEDWALE